MSRTKWVLYNSLIGGILLITCRLIWSMLEYFTGYLYLLVYLFIIGRSLYQVRKKAQDRSVSSYILVAAGSVMGMTAIHMLFMFFFHYRYFNQ